ncbi:PepSY-associated TM helix domain-containing protein [Thioclava sp. SK-1]|uniref:PepSY-associated TM helix domain-containing protein n=1 Tax=Thioclava sp. SK-1 TaxID=1889770 RepID=UPI00159F0C91|nr:PepSY-associated TM helix domain-containing protein [Thioclava sp. SK-1]
MADHSHPRGSRGWWLHHLHAWHWLTGAASLSILIFFALTGILLNHPGWVPANTTRAQQMLTVPADVMSAVAAAPTTGTGPLPTALAQWLQHTAELSVAGRMAEYIGTEIWIDLPRPGGNGLVVMDRNTGQVEVEQTRNGWLAVAMDLHKGRDSGAIWSLIIDALAVCVLLFGFSGLGLLIAHASARPATWPMTLGGIALPGVLIVLCVHL